MPLMYDRLDQKVTRRLLQSEDPDTRQAAEYLAGGSPAFEITNVVDLCHRMHGLTRRDADLGEHVLAPDAYPAFAPPFRSYWMEFRIADEMYTRARLGKLGVWCIENDDTSLGISLWADARRPFPVGFWKLRHDGEGHLMTEQVPPMVFVGDTNETVRRLNPSMSDRPLPRGERASIMEQEREVLDLVRATEGPEAALAFAEKRQTDLRDEADQAVKRMKELELGLIVQESRLLAWLVLPPVLMAHSLLGCKNVTTEEHHPNPKIARAHQKRRGHGLTIFKTLKIAPTGGSSESGPGVSIGDGQTAMHLVRGHFKTFTPERPLFGSRVGTYWWSPMVRGNQDAGVVVKDYEIA